MVGPVPKGMINRMKYDPETGCWNWTGVISNAGYGRVRYKGRMYGVHRLTAHFWLRFDLESELWVLHRCDNRACFNPKHLFIGTNSDNQIDSVKKNTHHEARKTHCLRGHELTPENVYTNNGGRYCRTCMKIREAARPPRRIHAVNAG